jgi:hypothetical protein
MKKNRLPHTTPDGRAKCLGYGLRSPGRCGRIAVRLVRFFNKSGNRYIEVTNPLCAECATIARQSKSGVYVDTCDRGFIVTTSIHDPMRQRFYRRAE